MSENAAIDENSRASMTAVLNTDGETIMRVAADASTGALEITTDTSGAVAADEWAYTDENDRPTMYAVSSDDGITPVPLRTDSSGNLLVKMV